MIGFREKWTRGGARVGSRVTNLSLVTPIVQFVSPIELGAGPVKPNGFKNRDVAAEDKATNVRFRATRAEKAVGMGFDYDRHKKGDGGGHEWGSYSDLFMCLSVVFLFLYVTTSLRTGTTGVQAENDKRLLARQVEDLREQLRVYNTLKTDYLETQASSEEQQMYNELMDKLKLLKEEAATEKDALRAQALENEKKELALNKYQQMIRNIINANVQAQARIKRREKIIDEKEEVISAKSVEIEELEKTVAEKRRAIEQSARKIAQAEAELYQKQKQLKQAYEQNKLTKQAFEAQQQRIRQEAQQRLEQLRQQNEQMNQQLASVATELQTKEQQLQTTASTLQQTQSTLAQKQAEAEKLARALSEADAKTQEQVAAMRAKFAADREKERQEFEKQIEKEKLSGAEKAAREAQFRAQAEAKAQALNDKIAGLAEQMKDKDKELAKARELANARKELAEKIKQNFARSGVKASVDPGTGDVLLDFGDQYFDTGKADLKPKMQDLLERAMPVYSASLFQDPKVAEKIQAVEIVGFASPTYKGKFVNPKSLAPGDRKAVNYNLDLSYSRAKAIFNHVFDTDKMTFSHQKRLLPLVKVTGRSFLTEAEREVASTSEDELKKAQRVIIKFNLGE